MILCSLKDVPEINQPREYFENFLTKTGEGKGGLYDYWKDISYGAISLDGSKIIDNPTNPSGWFTMNYSFVNNGNEGRAFWIAEAKRLATESGIDLRPYPNIMVVVNALVDAGRSGSDILITIAGPWGQNNWRWCKNCHGLAYSPDGKPSGTCAQDLTSPVPHDFISSEKYSLALDDLTLAPLPEFQPGWRQCINCKALCFSADGKPSGICPYGLMGASGKHEYESGNYSLGMRGVGFPAIKKKEGWRRCKKCEGLVLTAGICPANGGPHYQYLTGPGSADYNIVVDDPKAKGESGWRRCTRCEGLAFSADGNPSGSCRFGGKHDYYVLGKDPPVSNYTLIVDEPTAAGRSGWRLCKKCSGLVLSLDRLPVGACPGTGDHHDVSEGGNYTLAPDSTIPSGEKNWRYCINCSGLAYTGGAAAGEGKCPKGFDHDLTGDILFTLVKLDENNMDVNYAAHEMGHCYGLGHAKMVVDEKDKEYGDKWDIMASRNGWQFTGTFFGASGPGLIAPGGNSGPGLSAPNLVNLDWMPIERIYTYDRRPDPVTIELEPLDTIDPIDPKAKLMARIIKPDCVYTIEFRHPFSPKGWDRGIPHSGVVIHKERTLYNVGSKGWRRCVLCQGLALSVHGDPSGFCPAGGNHQYDGSNYSLGYGEPTLRGYPGQSGWRWCHKCQGLAYSETGGTSGICPGGADHHFLGVGDYTLMHFEGSSGESGWRWCSICQGLAYSKDGSASGVCPASIGIESYNHDFTGSANYTLPNSATDRSPFFVPSVVDGDPSGWDWRPYQMFKDEKSDIAVRVDSIDLIRFGRPHPAATITIGNSSLEPHRIPEMENRRLVVARNSSHELQVIVAASRRPDGTSDDIWQKRASTTFSSGWSAWSRLQKEKKDRGITLAVERNRDDKLEAFAIGTSNDFWHTQELTAGSGDWTDWTLLGKPTNKGISLAVKMRNDNFLEAFAIGTSNDFWHTIQKDPSTGSWSDWETLGNPIKIGFSLAVERRYDDFLEVFAIDPSFDFWHIWQTGPGPKEWSAWTRLGRPIIKGQKLVVARDQANRLEAFAIDTSNIVWSSHQKDPSNGDWSWSDWEILGGGLGLYKAISLAVATNRDGRLEVFAIDMSFDFWHIWQIDPDHWVNDGWVRLGGQTDRGTTLAVERNRDDKLEAFTFTIDAVGVDPTDLAPRDIRHTLQDPSTNKWISWTNL
jgi:hypothetical protein